MAKRRTTSKRAKGTRRKPENDLETLLQKHSAGEKLSQAEQRRVAKFRREVMPDLVFEYLKQLPKGDYESVTGRDRRMLDAQAHRWGLPLSGETLDVVAILRAFHDFVGEHAKTIRAAERVKVDTKDVSKAKLRLYLAKAKREELAYERDRAALVPLDMVEEVFIETAGVLRRHGDWLGKRKLRDAHREHERTLQSVKRIGRRLFAKLDPHKDEPDDDADGSD
ncbi:MAG: hypothetical protein ACPGXK_00145 [Phycisphaerae bacterium]